MSALRPMISRSVVQAARYQVRTKATIAVPPRNQYSFKKDWLSDPSTYPIIVIMGGGLTFMVGMGFNALFGYKDVQINPNKRGSMLTTWGSEHRVGVCERVVKATGGVKAEGLGIDHEAWAKQKAEYMKQ